MGKRGVSGEERVRTGVGSDQAGQGELLDVGLAGRSSPGSVGRQQLVSGRDAVPAWES